MTDCVIITYNRQDSTSAEIAEKIRSDLSALGMQCILPESPERAAYSSGLRHICMITVGGDGTILRWGKHAARHSIPLLGVNTGRLGFMATLEPCDIHRIADIITGDFSTSSRMIMDVEIQRTDGSRESWEALNDVVAERDRSSKLPEFDISCGSSVVSRICADGMIFSTPTGSTAYALSAGGAIIAPDMECIECTPLCPHTLFSRPMIFSVSNEITLSCSAYHGGVVTISVDSERGIPFSDGDVLKLTRSRHTLRLIEAGEGFFGAVRNKLMTPLK